MSTRCTRIEPPTRVLDGGRYRIHDVIVCGLTSVVDVTDPAEIRLQITSSAIEINRVWCLAATIACDLLCWLRLLCLDGPLASAEPKTLRY